MFSRLSSRVIKTWLIEQAFEISQRRARCLHSFGFAQDVLSTLLPISDVPHGDNVPYGRSRSLQARSCSHKAADFSRATQRLTLVGCLSMRSSTKQRKKWTQEMSSFGRWKEVYLLEQGQHFLLNPSSWAVSIINHLGWSPHCHR